MNTQKYSTSIRLEQDLKEKINAIANYEMRSIANQIQLFLNQSVDLYLNNKNIYHNKDLKEIKSITKS